MLSRLVKDHQTHINKLKEENENLKKEAISSMGEVTNGLVDSVNTGVACIFANQKKLETESRLLQQNTAKFSKQTNQWIQLIEGFNNSLKEIGDVENWSRKIENDMHNISDIIDFLYTNTNPIPQQQQQSQQQQSPPSQPQ
ncbi:hypothetical protein DICPUDRAFT_82800 [Dictyostelium purpureum]|uniref:Biogenesis of lysosome-related organelles complex 1 subunit 1 n=1 Tax=Dictyostelium purpureum TaxID=5786 RepID=F0ZXM9_DICPU|nr:uncharacterized protein DICPUDRAFT_82800 [Dictyostelium purpureum]EGC31302.1 hypothetical protein DICPUDRAFT_82800 [Dictyostelium purpureum]|eukprot:XP_003292179.1 hypothetical protein DICPUDRAFT_82800 [Dictyostelium purpureum]